jgi:hypothetical protein
MRRVWNNSNRKIFLTRSNSKLLSNEERATSVTQIARNGRVASFIWLHGMIRDAQARSLVFDLMQQFRGWWPVSAGRSGDRHVDWHLSQT